MILPDFKAFPRTGRIVGIDWGATRTGVAVADASREFVFTRPVIVASRAGADLPRVVVELARAENAVGIVVGLPLYADGTESDTTARVRNFINALANQTDLPICTIDESYSSISAQDDMGRIRRDDIKQKLDSESARVILENAIALIRRA